MVACWRYGLEARRPIAAGPHPGQVIAGPLPEGLNAWARITLVKMRVARLLCLLAVLAGLLVAASPAQAVAPSVTTVVNALNEHPYYIDPAVKISAQQRHAIQQAAVRAPTRMRLAL